MDSAQRVEFTPEHLIDVLLPAELLAGLHELVVQFGLRGVLFCRDGDVRFAASDVARRTGVRGLVQARLTLAVLGQSFVLLQELIDFEAKFIAIQTIKIGSRCNGDGNQPLENRSREELLRALSAKNESKRRASTTATCSQRLRYVCGSVLWTTHDEIWARAGSATLSRSPKRRGNVVDPC